MPVSEELESGSVVGSVVSVLGSVSVVVFVVDAVVVGAVVVGALVIEVDPSVVESEPAGSSSSVGE
jgi:hypothetical protein